MNPSEAASIIRQGGVVAFPTETVYGLGADAGNEAAVSRIFEIKGRPADNPLIIHLSGSEEAAQFAEEIPVEAQRLMESCWPGPLTLILRKRPGVSTLVTAGLRTVALRVPDHPLALELIRRSGPLAAPSANRSGRPSPTKAAHVREDFGDSVPLLEGDEAAIGLESTVLDLTTTPFTILRPGYYTAETLSRIAGTDIVHPPGHQARTENSAAESAPSGAVKPGAEIRSPGLRHPHYRPAASVCWYDPSSPPDPDTTLLITHHLNPEGYPHHRHLSGNFTLLARELYSLFRDADRLGLPLICVERLPEHPLHPLLPALRNRLEMAIGTNEK